MAAAVPTRAGGAKPGVARGGLLHIDPSYPFRFQRADGQLVPIRQRALARTRPSRRLRLLSHEPQVGELRNWAGLDIVHGAIYPKAFTLRGVGEKIEVWVATGRRTFAGASSVGTDFQDGDCRNGVRTAITDDQVSALVRAFDGTIYPRESAVFSVPPSRDGAGAVVGPPAFHPQGRGDRVVVLVDNVRDEAFFDLNNANDFGEVLGVYSSALEQLFDRNMMTIDAFDWLHRTGRRPEHYEDPDEVDWLDEGLAEWARSLTGYADPDRPVTELGHDRHTQCFLGNLPDLVGGPQNSLTLWGDAGNPNCDYGAVYSFMEYVHARFGRGTMTALHRGDAYGLAGLQEALGRRAIAQDVLHDWAASLATDVNWDSPDAYDKPGAAPNGADFVRLRDASGRYLRENELRSLSFDGASAIPGRPVEWTVTPTPPNGGTPALYTGAGNNLDRTIVRPLTIPAGGAELGFEAQWNVEEDPSGGWDFTFVQVSTDGGATYRSIACTSSRSDASPNARPVMHANLPGYTAYSGGWRNERCNLGAFAGRSILLAFRHVTDGSIPGDPDDPTATIPPGFWLRNVTLGGSSVADGSSLAGWLSLSQARPTAVHDFTLQLVGYSSRGHRKVSSAVVRLDARHDAELGRSQLRQLLRSNPDVVGAIVMYDEPTEQVQDYAPYRLTVNGVLQPGG